MTYYRFSIIKDIPNRPALHSYYSTVSFDEAARILIREEGKVIIHEPNTSNS